MSGRIERFVEANGLRHHVLEWGRGEGTVLIAHGWADAAGTFDLVARALVERGLRVVAFSFRGFGRTEWAGRGGYYHFPDYVLDLSELTEVLELGRYALVGHSMGGAASALFAGSRPPGLAALVLAEGLGPPVSSDGYGRRLREWIDGVRSTRQKPLRPMASLAEATARLRVQHPDLSDALAERVVPHLVVERDGGLFFAFDPLHKTRAPFPFQLPLFTEALSSIAVPTLVISGTRGFRNADHEARVAAIPDVREAHMDDVGHMMHWHAPERFAALVAEFAHPILTRSP
jgi:pimeloyl-ACP methyl ester carboxylesterase